MNDNPATKELARRAVELIGQSRKSEGLKYFLKTGEAGTTEMDVADAYRLLQIPDRTIDDGAIMAAYTICVDEAPAQAEKYNQALSLIAQEKNSSLLGSMVPGFSAQPDRDLSEWPVGLQNIGNTCYLNSLLQFYFSVRPFREMVLDFESFKMEFDVEDIAKKQVGSRKVHKQEVERSQRCKPSPPKFAIANTDTLLVLRELRTLFNDMITCPGSYVVPGQELARLTLISPSNEAAIRRRSTISAVSPSTLGEINGMPIVGPLGPPQAPPVESETRDPNESTPVAGYRPTSEGGSDATLVSDTARPDAPSTAPADSTVPAENKENTLPTADVSMTEAGNDTAPDATTGNDDDAASPKQQEATPVADFHLPPPIPPRPVPQVDQKKQLIDEVEIGAQQDVTEVINNVLFQSQCAIRPIGIAPDGEQLDQIKECVPLPKVITELCVGRT